MTLTLSKSALLAPTALAPTAGLLAANVPVCFSDPSVVDLCLYRGDSGRIRVTVNTPSGVVGVPPTPYDLTGATWDCEIRATADATVVLATLAVEPVAGQTNAIDIVLTAAQSELVNDNAVWDLEMTMGVSVTTLLRGRVIVTKDVSR